MSARAGISALDIRESALEKFLDFVFNFADNPFALFSALFIAALVNTFLPPVPIEIGTVFAGYLVSEGHGSLYIVISAATLGMFSGSVIFYLLAGIYGPGLLRIPFFARLIKEDTLSRSKAWFEKYGALSLFATKFVPGMYFCAVIASSLLSLKRSKIYATFFFVNLAAFTLLAFIGKTAGENWRSVYAAMGKTGALVIASLLLAGSAVYLIRKLPRKKQPR